jgi:hypothetical protein
MLLESIYSAGITHDEHHMMIIICLHYWSLMSTLLLERGWSHSTFYERRNEKCLHCAYPFRQGQIFIRSLDATKTVHYDTDYIT